MASNQATNAAASQPPAPTISDLPDDLLVRCLAPLSQKERFKTAALVSTRWQRVCLAPALLRSLKFESDINIWRLAALWEFLVRHGAHVRSLDLQVWPTDITAAEEATAEALMFACVAACGSLERVDFNTCLGAPMLHGLAGLGRLQKLGVHSYATPLTLPACLSSLTALRDLELEGEEVGFEGGQLPPGLTRLELRDYGATQSMPIEVTSLANLSRLDLEFHAQNFEPDSLAPLSSLATLRTLRWDVLGPLPASMSALTQLECLWATQMGGNEGDATMQVVLPHLQGLTALAIGYGCFRGEGNPPQGLPSTLASLPRLHRLCIHMGGPLLLPSGPWLASLRWLGLRWPVLAANAQVLRGAAQLEYLAVLGPPQQGEEGSVERQGWDAAWSLLEALPALRCCSIPTWDGGQPLLQALFRLKERRPELGQRSVDFTEFQTEMLELSDVPGSS